MNEQETVVVTGASSGVGKSSVQLLAENGYRVFACVRKETDCKDLKKLYPKQVMPLIVDLQAQKTIEEAIPFVSQISGDKGLKGLINCAGTIFSGPLEYIPRKQWFAQYDVNLFGTMAFTAAMLPLIRKGQGRIITIGAVGGGIALPFFGAIASSKIALEAANDCLRRELHPWGIPVIIVDPGGIDTPANDKMRQSVKDFMETQNALVQERYGAAMETFTRWAYNKHKHNLTPAQVAKTVVKALRSKHPRIRYRLGWDSRGAALASWLLPEWLFDKVILWIASLPIGFGAWRDKTFQPD